MATVLAEPINLEHLPFQVDGGIAARAGIGIIVLATDQTLEHEFRVLLRPPGVAFYESRIWNENAITPDTLRAMEARLADAARLILPDVPLDVIAFGCTSGTMMIGEERVFERIRAARPGIACTTPITAALEALRVLGSRRIGLLTPYRADINLFIRDYIEARGIAVPVMGSFNEEDDRRIARIDARSMRDAAVQIGSRPEVDGLFVSCTSVRFAEVVAEVEAELGKPVTSSNHAMAWHCLRLAGVDDPQPAYGRLFQLTL